MRHWVNDGLLTVFFLVVGLEIKREFTVGHLASRRSAALPIAGAIGGMAVPALPLSVGDSAGPGRIGWGVPMATDTAFAVALIVMLGARVPVELRIFLTAAAIVDDIGAIVVVALFYSGDLHFGYLAAALAITGLLALLNRSGVYRVTPYIDARRRAVGLRSRRRPACDAGRRAPGRCSSRRGRRRTSSALMMQANTIMTAEARHRGESAAPRAVRCRRCRPSMRSMTGSSRRRTACCGTSDRAPATWCCRCSRWPMPASLGMDVLEAS